MDKNQIAETPPMGWNSYDYYDTAVTEEQVRANADYMAEHLAEYGWEYIVVDIQWYAYGAGSRRDLYQYIPFGKVEMDEYSRLLPCPERFPSSAGGAGFRPLADYIHEKGLKFGIHIMRGIPRIAAHMHGRILGTLATADEIADPASVCRWNPDMYGVRPGAAGAQEYYDSLLQMYADWGVDFIKCDDICNTNMYPHNPYSAEEEIEMLHKAIIKTGKKIVLSLSPGPAVIEKAWHYEKYANMWRITDDFWDDWNLLLNMFERCELWQNHVSKGCYPDCDMLPLGYLGKGFGQERQTGFTYPEQVTMMTLWCIFGSPLMLGAELTKLDEPTLSLLTNREVLSLLKPEFRARQIKRDRNGALWYSRNTVTGESYAAVFSFREEEAPFSFRLEEICGMDSKARIPREGLAREVWTGSTVRIEEGMLCGRLAAHGAGLYHIE